MANLNFVKNHWKKLSFATAGLSYGLWTLKSHIEIRNHMRSISQLISTCNNDHAEPKQVLVVMNPAANNKKTEKMFQKYCEPLLHLAGYSINVFKTNYIGHAKNYIEELQTLPDAIVIAGGDGTSSEVVTGLLRRNQSPCPILIIPLGNKNKPNKSLQSVKQITEAIVPMINENIQFKSVFKVNLVDKEEIVNPKPIYGLTKFSWGLLHDIESIKNKYWYFGNYRYYAAALFNMFSDDLNWKFSTNFINTPTCSGCSDCTKETKQNEAKYGLLKRFFFSSIRKDVSPTNTINRKCNKYVEGYIETNQLSVVCQQNLGEQELETRFINSFTPGLNFIKNISNIYRDTIEPSLVMKSQVIKFIPKSTSKKTFYSIDGEEYEAHAVEISLIPNAIKMFC